MEQYNVSIQSDWLDHYGHLNEGYYVVAFSNATWPLQHSVGIGKDYFDSTGCALYTIESHIRYLKEVRYPGSLNIESMIFDSREKKVWIGHELKVDGDIRATFECILIHYDTNLQRSVAIPKSVQKMLQEKKTLKIPYWVGNSISIDKK